MRRTWPPPRRRAPGTLTKSWSGSAAAGSACTGCTPCWRSPGSCRGSRCMCAGGFGPGWQRSGRPKRQATAGGRQRATHPHCMAPLTGSHGGTPAAALTWLRSCGVSQEPTAARAGVGSRGRSSDGGGSGSDVSPQGRARGGRAAHASHLECDPASPPPPGALQRRLRRKGEARSALCAPAALSCAVAAVLVKINRQGRTPVQGGQPRARREHGKSSHGSVGARPELARWLIAEGGTGNFD